MATLHSNRVRRALRYDRLNRAIEKPFRREIIKLKNRYIDSQVAHWKKTGHFTENLTTQLAIDLDHLFHKYQGRAIRLSAQETLRQVGNAKSAPITEVKRDLWEQYLIAWATQYGARKVREIARTTYEDLNRMVTAAFESGEDETEIIKVALRAKGLSAYRADTIARTETHSAATFAARETIKDLAAEVGAEVKKIWQPVIDDRTREDHIAMAGSPAIPFDQPFEVGGEQMDRPGDPSASPGNTINCRCVCLYET